VYVRENMRSSRKRVSRKGTSSKGEFEKGESNATPQPVSQGNRNWNERDCPSGKRSLEERPHERGKPQKRNLCGMGGEGLR